MPHQEPDSGAEKPVLLITGASSGIGAATARAVACDVTEWDQVEALAAHALTAPPGVEINEILIRPTAQRG